VLAIICLLGAGCGAGTGSKTEPSLSTPDLTPAMPAPTSGAQYPLPALTHVAPTPTTAVATAVATTVVGEMVTPDRTGFPEQMLQSYGNCRLPCWWGIVPGTTDWDSARVFLESHALQVAPYERDGYTYYTAYLVVPERVSTRPVANDFAVWDGTVQLISALGQTGSRFTPAAVLKEYGMPDEVWLQTARAPREGYLGFVIALLYSGEGILIHYGGQGVLDKEDVVGCIPNAGGSLRLLAWNPELRLGYVDAMAIGMSTTIVTDDIDLESATGMTLGEFYDRFSAEGTELCLHTPQVLWPWP